MIRHQQPDYWVYPIHLPFYCHWSHFPLCLIYWSDLRLHRVEKGGWWEEISVVMLRIIGTNKWKIDGILQLLLFFTSLFEYAYVTLVAFTISLIIKLGVLFIYSSKGTSKGVWREGCFRKKIISCSMCITWSGYVREYNVQGKNGFEVFHFDKILYI